MTETKRGGPGRGQRNRRETEMESSKISVAAVKRMRPMGWADFKHKLVARGVMARPDANVPQDWGDAFLKAHGRARRKA